MSEEIGRYYDIVLIVCMESLDTKADFMLVGFAYWSWNAEIRPYSRRFGSPSLSSILIAAVIGLGDTSAILHRRWVLTRSAASAGNTVPPQGSLALEQTKINVHTRSSESGSQLRINMNETPQGSDR